MKFFDQLQQLTHPEREHLQTLPVIRRCLAGEVSLDLYLSFLTQAWHHVRHTVPLLMAVGARLPPHHEWLRAVIVEYVLEEQGHDQWIVNDIAAAGGDAVAVLQSTPSVETDALVAYAWDTVMRRNPVGFFGMVLVLEGTSVTLALAAARQIQDRLQLPDRAMTYLRSHGELDREHVQHLAEILNRLESGADRAAVTQCARAIYWLYARLLGSLDRPALTPAIDSQVRRLA